MKLFSALFASAAASSGMMYQTGSGLIQTSCAKLGNPQSYIKANPCQCNVQCRQYKNCCAPEPGTKTFIKTTTLPVTHSIKTQTVPISQTYKTTTVPLSHTIKTLTHSIKTTTVPLRTIVTTIAPPGYNVKTSTVPVVNIKSPGPIRTFTMKYDARIASCQKRFPRRNQMVLYNNCCGRAPVARLPVRTFQSSSLPVRTFQSISMPVRRFRSMPVRRFRSSYMPVRTFRSSSLPVRTFQSSSMPVRSWSSRSSLLESSPCISTLAHPCQPALDSELDNELELDRKLIARDYLSQGKNFIPQRQLNTITYSSQGKGWSPQRQLNTMTYSSQGKSWSKQRLLQKAGFTEVDYNGQ